MSADTAKTAHSEVDLRKQAACHASDCHAPGEPGHCHPKHASWTMETLDGAPFSHIWESQAHAFKWISEEIQMDIDDEMHRDWQKLLIEPIREEIICLIRGGRAYIWDGHHRAAALITTDRPIVAIVGRPLGNRVELAQKAMNHLQLPSREPLWNLDTNRPNAIK